MVHLFHLTRDHFMIYFELFEKDYQLFTMEVNYTSSNLTGSNYKLVFPCRGCLNLNLKREKR